jgi:hypothetical protein
MQHPHQILLFGAMAVCAVLGLVRMEHGIELEYLGTYLTKRLVYVNLYMTETIVVVRVGKRRRDGTLML